MATHEDNTEVQMTNADGEREKWQLAQLWGLDIPAVALCWALFFTRILKITTVTTGPLLVIAGSAWCSIMAARLIRSILTPDSRHALFYRSHLALIVILVFAVGMATVWMLLYYVGVSLLHYALFPAGLLLAALPLSGSVLSELKLLLQSMALALLCAVPAFYFSFTLSPLSMLFTPPVLYLGILFYLVSREQLRLQANRRQDFYSVICTVVLLVLLITAAQSGTHTPQYIKQMSITVAIGAGCLQGFSRLSRRLPEGVAQGICWIVMTLPAALGILLYAPRCR